MVLSSWVSLVSNELGLDSVEMAKLARQHRRKKTWEKIREADGAKRYALKYALKPDQKKVPKDFQDVGRFWGASRDVSSSVPAGIEVDITDEQLRDWLAETGNEVCNFPVIPKYVYKRLTKE